MKINPRRLERRGPRGEEEEEEIKEEEKEDPGEEEEEEEGKAAASEVLSVRFFIAALPHFSNLLPLPLLLLLLLLPLLFLFFPLLLPSSITVCRRTKTRKRLWS